MKKIKIIIEKGADLYAAYAENVEGIYGAGETVNDAKQSVVDAIQLLKKHNNEEHVPSVLKGEFELVWKFDTVSLLNYYKGVFTNSALERITGINQKQMQHYASGLKKPRALQAKKIETALHKLGKELLAVEL
ncbi:type II toxin-antitoxin system HicB family antitoxin [Dyadobacter psychrotolerans]|uniref:Type II toxin-antitoxin system HicB family antitoxin n=1 Tax=Dyadobacter psychrotolerans TaxID=2541721 RepID=A0A4R5DZB7_9BACT|nr:type II toxin-antitoxin system HicB family antitoxin [Dyadobacter psychrotolerans]TDE16573.1 type II toxin-antitoxin system HicB family antitoxin [Dyadobacter psychrotolerans]